jgi:putative transposase
MRLNEVGKIAQEEWLKTQRIRQALELDVFVIRPNHIHGIIVIKDESSIPNVGTHSCASLQRKPQSLRDSNQRQLLGSMKPETHHMFQYGRVGYMIISSEMKKN